MKAGVGLYIKIVTFLIFLSLIINVTTIPAEAEGVPSVSAKSAIVMIAATGEIVYEKNAYNRQGVASTTKILTCLTALENASITEKIIASKEAVAVEGTSIGLKPGDEIDLLTLVKGMLLESGNDAANVTAQLVSGNVKDFAVLMNKTAQKIGMNYSSFKNPSGLTEDGHYSCAYDMALLGSFAIKNPLFTSICSLKSCKVSFGNPQREVTFYNHNKLLSKYEGAFGIKTGFTKASGRCLVSAVEKDGVALVCVTLNAYDDWNDHIKLYDYSFSKVSKYTADVNENFLTVPVVNSTKKEAKLKLSNEVIIPYANEKTKYKTVIYKPHFLYADLKDGDYVGWIDFYTQSGFFIGKSYLLCKENIHACVETQEDNSFIEKFLK